MSVRLLTVRLIKNGRHILRSYWNREIHTNILEQGHLKTRSKRGLPVSTTAASNVLCNSAQSLARSAPSAAAATAVPRTAGTRLNNGLFRFGQHARKLFIDNILSRVTTNYSEELRQRATRKLFYGDSAPFFALIGVSLATGSGVLSKEDELEGVCWEIREAATRLQQTWNNDNVSASLNSDFTIDNLEVGPPIAKGCAAVVYAANFKDENKADVYMAGGKEANGENIHYNATHQTNSSSWCHELMSPLQNMSRFVHNFGGSVDNIYSYSQRQSAVSAFVENLAASPLRQTEETVIKDLEKVQMNQSEQTLANDISLHTVDDATATCNSTATSIARYPLALKMMFNYDIQSNALSILRAMYKETVPARQRHMNAAAEDWERLLQNQMLTLPTHPNIVCMFGFFCDEVRNFRDGHLLYPIAQPQRINPQGYGRNMSLYLLMKRYDLSLRDLLESHDLSTRNKILLFAQLLEAVTHLNRHGIAHRDLKSDNVLIEWNTIGKQATGPVSGPPVLVLSDFGCCLADRQNGLSLPYSSHDIDKGGNTALMAPEIINAQPGPFTVLNYSKSDLWACGALAYEIFGLPNPFYSNSNGKFLKISMSLRNSSYKVEELPPLSSDCPPLLQQLISNILNPNPSKRVHTDIAANVLQLFLWAPSNWLKVGGMPSSPEILQWLLSLTTKIMCEDRPRLQQELPPNRLGFINLHNQHEQRAYVEYVLICSFLARAQLRRIRGALNWIQNVVGMA